MNAPHLALFYAAVYALSTGVYAQNQPEKESGPPDYGWQRCHALTADDTAHLRCFDAWAKSQQTGTATPLAPVTPVARAEAPGNAQPPTPNRNCKHAQRSELSRFWELESDSDCGTFGIRGYKPISLSWVGANSVNTQPASPSPNHTATTVTPYSNNEARIQLSVRTKVAQGLLTQDQPTQRDSVWFGYTQQSYWQLFNSELSRPFRTTDHEPELIYIYPIDTQPGAGWHWRYAGLSLNHQSNGQSEPLSRSWNRQIVMLGLEYGTDWQLQARTWWRIPEAATNDDNPDISETVGRAELTGFWHVNPDNTLGLTLRHSLRASSNGSVRLEWLKKLGDSGFAGLNSGLRLHTQLFSGFGDSLLDYNRRRTVLSVGLSLVDW